MVKTIGLIKKYENLSGDKFLDDIYYNTENVRVLFIEYADKKGIKRLGNIDKNNIVAQVRKGLFDYFPYLDTLSYYNMTTGIISFLLDNFGDGIILALDSTDGIAEEIFCSNCRKKNGGDCLICNGEISNISDDYFEDKY